MCGVFVCVCVVRACNNTVSVWVKFASIMDLATTARNLHTWVSKACMIPKKVKISTCVCVRVCVCVCVCVHVYVRVKSQNQFGFYLQAYWIWLGKANQALLSRSIYQCTQVNLHVWESNELVK